MRCFIADLHIHTALSPCAGEEMTPPSIVTRALELGLGLIAITDHNSTGNIQSVIEAAQGTPLKVLPGMEIQTKEEVHLICLFANVEGAVAWQEVVYRHLPPHENVESFFGSQLLLDAQGRVRGREKRLLLQSTDLTIKEVVQGLTSFGGVAVPAHVDRQAYSLLGVLGFIPPDLPVRALEVSRPESRERIRNLWGSSRGWSLIASSDAHYLSDLGRAASCFYIQEATLPEIRLALTGEGGRKVVMVQRSGLHFRVVE
ncbi:MAG: PHP domain-containing protein [Moorellaceae bacterium]